MIIPYIKARVPIMQMYSLLLQMPLEFQAMAVCCPDLIVDDDLAATISPTLSPNCIHLFFADLLRSTFIWDQHCHLG